MANARERKEATLPKRFIVKVFRVEAGSKFALFTQENSDASWDHNPRSTEYAAHDSSKISLVPVAAFPSFFVLVAPMAMFTTVKTREGFHQKWAIRLCCKIISLLHIKIVKPFAVDKRLPQRRSSFINGLPGIFKGGGLHCCHLHLGHQANGFRILAQIKQKFNQVAPFIGCHRLCNTRRHKASNLLDFFNLITLYFNFLGSGSLPKQKFRRGFFHLVTLQHLPRGSDNAVSTVFILDLFRRPKHTLYNFMWLDTVSDCGEFGANLPTLQTNLMA